jgi:hypothetical protein
LTGGRIVVETLKLAIHKGEESELTLGGLRFRACRREIEQIDGGITLQVMGPSAAGEIELLRFDCFRKAPHYHVPGENPKETKIDPKAFGDGRDWVYGQFSSNARALLEEAGWTPSTEDAEFVGLGDLTPRLRAMVEALPEPTQTSYFEIDPALLGQTRGGDSSQPRKPTSEPAE